MHVSLAEAIRTTVVPIRIPYPHDRNMRFSSKLYNDASFCILMVSFL